MDDARLVQMALEQGLVTKEQVAHAEQELLRLRERGLDNSVWYLLQDLGSLPEEAARRIRKGISSSSLAALEVDGYLIQGRLGAGGMGDVYRARNSAGKEVAVKLLGAKYHGNAEYQRRFDREARASMRLQHPHICRSIGAGAVQGTRYLLMEVVEGPSLKARIQDQGPINEREALALLEQMASALGHAWDQGVLHRDVKPANIIIGPARSGSDEPFCAKLIDFGLAKVWQEGTRECEDSTGALTGAGLALGTPHYMSPEQASGQNDLDQRCDIYGLGSSLYHALMGHTMYSGKSSAVIMYKQVTETIDLSELRKKGARKQLVELLERMLAKDRNRRMASWAEVLTASQRIKSLLHAGLGTAPAADRSGPTTSPRVSAVITAAIEARAPQEKEIAAPATATTASRWPFLLAASFIGLVTIAALGWLAVRPPGAINATPDTLAAALRNAGPGELHLVPGDYPLVRLGATHAGVVLRAESSGTTLAGLAVDPGAAVELIGIDLLGPLSVAAGARVQITGGRIAVVTVEGGRLDLRDSHATGAVSIGRQGTFAMRGGRLAAGLRAEDSSAELSGTAIDGSVQVVRSVLRLDNVRVDGRAGAALILDRAPTVELLHSELTSAAIAVTATGSRLVRCEQVRITAGQTGISWIGPTDPTWMWQGLHIEAPQPATGLPTALLAAAASPAGSDPRSP